MTTSQLEPSIDEYLRKRLMPVEGAIPQLPGIEMYGNSIPAGTVGGDLFEYINFQQRYNIDARIARALKLSKEYLEPLPKGQTPRNSVDDHVRWLKIETGLHSNRRSRVQKSKKLRATEDRRRSARTLTTAGVLLVDARAWDHLGKDCINRSRHVSRLHAFGAGSERKNHAQVSSRRSISGWRSQSQPAMLGKKRG